MKIEQLIVQHICNKISKLINDSVRESVQMPNKEKVVDIKNLTVTIQDDVKDDLSSLRFEASAKVVYKLGDGDIEKPCNFTGYASLEINVNQLINAPFVIRFQQ